MDMQLDKESSNFDQSRFLVEHKASVITIKACAAQKLLCSCRYWCFADCFSSFL